MQISPESIEMQRISNMIPNRISLPKLSGALALALMILLPYHAAQAALPSLTTLYSFEGNDDGSAPEADLILGPSGEIYGTTYAGGTFGWGTVFMLTPPASAGGAWAESILYDFTGGDDGANPQASLLLASNGTLYGTTFTGGTLQFGTLFQLSPPASPGGAWTETVLYNFQGGPVDGANPQSKLLLSTKADVLFGTTKGGGVDNSGIVFQFSLSTQAYSVLYNFTGNVSGSTDGADPQASLLVDKDHHIFGTTYGGGASGSGTVFELALFKGANGHVEWKEKVIYSFCSLTACADGGIPNAGLFLDASGNLYGSTFWGGNGTNCLESGYPSGCGVVFELSPPAKKGGNWTQSVLYGFTGKGSDGAHPNLNPLKAVGGAIYGTTYSGGNNEDNCFGGGSYRGCGTIYRLTPPGQSGSPWTETTVHIFHENDGGGPYGLIRGPAGSGVLYGATSVGGTSGDFGTVFQFMP